MALPMAAEDFLKSLPPEFRATPYVAEAHPGAPGVQGVAAGANCQQYAYEVLRLFGFDMPLLWSSELFDDDTATVAVPNIETAAPLDLLLFNDTVEPHSAHVGLYLGGGQVLHLSYYVGKPAIWKLDAFAAHPKYGELVGIKRPVRRVGP